MLAMGNPYLAQEIPAVQNYLCAFSNATVSEISAVKALFGEIAIRGHLPVSDPEHSRSAAEASSVPHKSRKEVLAMGIKKSSINGSLSLAVVLAAFTFLPACSVDVKDHDDHGNSKVDIKTPGRGHPR